MTTTTLDASFLRAVVLLTSFRPRPMERAQIALLTIGLTGIEFTADIIPGELRTRPDGAPDTHISGCAAGGLASIGLLQSTGRIKSPDPAAKGRKLDVWRIPADRYATARAWLLAHGVDDVPQLAAQGELFANGVDGRSQP